MFEQVLAVEYARGSRAWTTMAGLAGQALIVGAAVLAPLVGPQALPHPQTLVRLFYPEAPPAPPPAGPPAAAAPRPSRPALQLRDGQVAAPASMPARAALIEEPPLSAAEAGGWTGGVPGGVAGGIPGGIPGGLPEAVARGVAPPAAPVPQAAPPEKPAAPERIRLGGQVMSGKLVHQVAPVYPPLARLARVSGAVELVGIVGTDGRIRQLQVVSGHPMLVKAALEAVWQWVYRPTLLNGDPVEVIAPITVSFVMR